jgi:SAM-dependent methyltransferase
MTYDRHDLYERTVQSPDRIVSFLRAIHGRSPVAIGEDFCGTAAVSRAWTRLVPDGTAVAIDLDATVLERARTPGIADRLERIQGDARSGTDPAIHRADVIFVGNFSIGEIHDRSDLVSYLARSRSRLRAGGVFVCDTYGGASAFRVGSIERSHWIEGGARIPYAWEQRAADPLTGEVVCAMHFRIERAGEITLSIEDAFVYRWRLWSVPELRDAMIEAGFAWTEVRSELYGDPGVGLGVAGEPSRASLDPTEGFIVCVAGHETGVSR